MSFTSPNQFSGSLLRYSCWIRWQKQYSTLALPLQRDMQKPLQNFRTKESNPVNHSKLYLHRLYTIPDDITKILFPKSGMPKKFYNQVETFNECSILIRNPAIEIISYLEQTDYNRPINKYVLYGAYGTGKTITLMHILHYAFMKEMIIVHVPTPNVWFRFPQEISNFDKMSGIIDLPVDAGKWLLHFKSQNNNLLSKLNLKVSKDYEWSKRETTVSGSSLLEMIEFGINRIRYASSVIDALLNELKEAGKANKCKVLAAMDGCNAFWSDYTCIRNDNKVIVSPKQISLTSIFTNFVKADWCNGAAVLIVDTKASKDRRESDHPRYLLSKDGFEHLDPFLPILLENYCKIEFHSIMEYYKERKWVRNITYDGLKELWVLSNGNPLELMNICRYL